MQKEKFLNLELKTHYLGIFGLQFWKNIVIFENQHSRICQNLKIFAEQNNSNLGPKVPHWVFLGCSFEKLLSYLKSAT